VEEVLKLFHGVWVACGDGGNEEEVFAASVVGGLPDARCGVWDGDYVVCGVEVESQHWEALSCRFTVG
jgi:hypothetical protein